MVPGESGPVISVLEEQRQDGDTATVQPRPTVVQTARVIKPKPVTPAMKVKTVLKLMFKLSHSVTVFFLNYSRIYYLWRKASQLQ